MAIEIRPFNEQSESSDPAASSSGQDARATSYMESLRSRVNDQDETQRKTWLKKTRSAVRRSLAEEQPPVEVEAPAKPRRSTKKPAKKS